MAGWEGEIERERKRWRGGEGRRKKMEGFW